MVCQLNLLVAALALALCAPIQARVARRNGTIDFQLGSDAPSDPATTGYLVNHLSLNVRNLSTSIAFYEQVFGMRHMFTIQVSEHYSFAYVAHSHGGRNGTGYQTAVELNRERPNSAGMIELWCLNVPQDSPPSSESVGRFGHLGIVVPDTRVAQGRFDAIPGLDILKRHGDPFPTQGPIIAGNALSQPALAQLDAGERKIIQDSLTSFHREFIFLSDPDGNIIEVQPQEQPAIV